MKNSWNLFWTDYAELLKESDRFCRKHWIGVLVYGVLLALYMIAIYFEWFDKLVNRFEAGYESVKTRLTSVFEKGKHEKE